MSRTFTSSEPRSIKDVDGRYGIFFGAHQIANIDLTSKESVGDVSEQVSVMFPD
jgi:putative transposase